MSPFVAQADLIIITGPASVNVGDSFQLQLIGDFGNNGLLAGGINFLFDAALVTLDNITLDLAVDPTLSCPGAALCPPPGSGTAPIVWGQFLVDLIAAGAGGNRCG